jgi:tetratricopeptide (TPR) repeat protein
MNAEHGRWTEQLSAYVDGDLGWEEQAEIEAHLRECAGCVATLADLRRVVARADGLEDQPPSRELWSGILRRIEAMGAAGGPTEADVVDIRERGGNGNRVSAWNRRFSLSLPQLAAASIAMILLSAGTAWLALAGRDGAGLAAGSADPGLLGSEMRSPVSPRGVDSRPGVTLTGTDLPLVTKYESAIADLEEALQLGEGTLDVETLAALRRSMAVIDRAIDEAREALEADPNSAYLNSHLADTMRKKMNLLRYANYFATAQS